VAFGHLKEHIFCFQKALGYSWSSNFLQSWRCKRTGTKFFGCDTVSIAGQGEEEISGKIRNFS
jgi:hypothetical protein